MSITRRTLLKSAMFAAAASKVGRATAEDSPGPRSPEPRISLRIFDSRSPESRAWLGVHATGAIDVAQEHATRWSTLRSITPRAGVEGFTLWSDFVQARGVLEQKGKRLRAEARSGRWFQWEMV
jgi:hypothetical protein